MFLQQVINGLTLGCIYALIALGYTLIFGIIKLINFAQGEVSMVGAYIAVGVIIILSKFGFLTESLFLSLTFVFLVTVIGCSLLGILVELVAFRPLRNSPSLSALITSLGVSIFLQNGFMLLFGSENKIFPSLFQKLLPLENTHLSYLQIFIIVLSLILMLLLHLFIKKTKLGKSMRAVSENKVLSSLMGININKTIRSTFIVASILGGVSGIMLGMYYGVARYDMGLFPGIKAFTAAILGGIGNVPGAMVGGVVLGIVESLSAGYISVDYKDIFAFILLIIVLIFKPQGFLGEKVSQE
ncbi:branched-chain amino acid ABC transporter permease [bacterium]|nr:branched-chain amino acid ABC transporter permease [bacterium]MBU1153302.1 branched-chain amino acid ABC transporter permease [bacterium]